MWAGVDGPAAPVAKGVADASWPKEIGAVLEERFQVTYNALENMRAQMTVLRGSKELMWITYGIPGTIRFVDHS